MSAIQSSLPVLPDELILSVFSHLTPQQLAQYSRVCQVWHRLAFEKSLWDRFDLRTVFPEPVQVIDEKLWAEFADVQALALNFKYMQPLDNRAAIPEVSRFFQQLKEQEVEIEGNAGLTILSIPRNLTSDSLQAIGQNEKGNKLDLENRLRGNFVHSYSGYRILITNGILKGKLKFDDLLRKIRCRKPDVLEAVPLAVMTFKSTTPPVRVFSSRSISIFHSTLLTEVFIRWTNPQSLQISHQDLPEQECGTLAVCDFEGFLKPAQQ